MNCALALRMLDAHVDDELDAATAAELVGHLASCPACARLHEQRLAMRTALRAATLRHAAPQGLRKAIMREIEVPVRPARRSPAPRWWHAVVFGTATAVLGAMGGWWVAQPHLQESLPDDAVARHVASLAPAGPRIDVASSDRHVVRPWFQGRAEFAPLVRDLSGQGFDLLGARLEQVGGRPAVAIVYRLHGHIIDVFSWRATGDVAAAEREATVRGFHVATWRDGDLGFAVVSDTDAAELKRFVQAFRAP